MSFFKKCMDLPADSIPANQVKPDTGPAVEIQKVDGSCSAGGKNSYHWFLFHNGRFERVRNETVERFDDEESAVENYIWQTWPNQKELSRLLWFIDDLLSWVADGNGGFVFDGDFWIIKWPDRNINIKTALYSYPELKNFEEFLNWLGRKRYLGF